MFTKEDIIEEMKKNPELKDAVVLYGSSLVLHEIKESTNDIDLFVHPDDWSSLDNTKLKKVEGSWVYKDVFDLGRVKEGSIYYMDEDDINELLFQDPDRPNRFLSFTVKYQEIGAIVKDKLDWGREKDIEDVQLIISVFRKKKRLALADIFEGKLKSRI